LYKFWFLYPLLFGVKLRTVFDRTEHHLSVCVRIAHSHACTPMAHIKHICLFLLSKKNLVKNLWCDSLKIPPQNNLFLPLQKVANSSHPEPLLMSESSDNVLNLKLRDQKLHKSEDTLFIKSINKCLYHIRETYKTRKTSDFFFCFVFVTTICQIKCFSPHPTLLPCLDLMQKSLMMFLANKKTLLFDVFQLYPSP